jgi:hypothetical protein
MISAYKGRASVKKGGIVEIRCPDLQPDTIVDVIILITSIADDKERENFETKKYPVSDFSVLLNSCYAPCHSCGSRNDSGTG